MNLLVALFASFFLSAGAAQAWPLPATLPRYDISVQLNYADHWLTASQRVEVVNRWQTATEVAFHIPALAQPGVFQMYRVVVGDNGEPLEHRQEGTFIFVPLPDPWQRGETLVLYMDFALQLATITGGTFATTSLGWSDISLNAGHWHPILAPYDAARGGWQTWDASDIGDPYTSESADYTVTIETAPGVQIVAGGTETRDGDTWRFVLRGAREFGFVASDRWEVAETVSGDVRVRSYFLAEHRQAGEDVLRTAVDALRYYSHLFGPYPHREYRIVETRAYGGMEFSGFTYISDGYYANYLGGPRTNLMYTLVHEVSHQWWYSLVGNDQVREPWLDEAFADYSTWLLYQTLYPQDADWWWGFYVTPWSPEGAVDSDIYTFADSTTYLVTVYRQGMRFLVDVAEAMGRDRLLAGLRLYARRYAYRLATGADLYNTLRVLTPADLAPIWERYMAQPLPVQGCPYDMAACWRGLLPRAVAP